LQRSRGGTKILRGDKTKKKKKKLFWEVYFIKIPKIKNQKRKKKSKNQNFVTFFIFRRGPKPSKARDSP
jgi:hypothetical protein